MKYGNYFGASFVILVLGWGFYLFNNQKTFLVSPVLGESKIAFSDNVWFPKESTESAKVEEIDRKLTAKAAFFVETQTGQVLYQKNPQERLPIASLNKIMTAIISMENRQMEDKISISQKAAEMEPDKMFLIAGEKLTVRELLEGVFLISANDASEALAEGVTGRREEFINLMNSKAAQLGMYNTRFVNPSGLEEEGRQQYSTVYEVAIMSRYAIKKWPQLIDISSSEHIFIPVTSTHQDYDLYSGINLLTTYPGVVGFKTGFTPEAGLTLVTVARRGGKEVLGVLLGAVNRRDDAKLLLDYSFKKLGVI